MMNETKESMSDIVMGKIAVGLFFLNLIFSLAQLVVLLLAIGLALLRACVG